MTTTSLGTRLGIRKVTARIGAEIPGLGPSLELDPDGVAAVRAALNEHKALVFRGIDLDDEGQQRSPATSASSPPPTPRYPPCRARPTCCRSTAKTAGRTTGIPT